MPTELLQNKNGAWLCSTCNVVMESVWGDGYRPHFRCPKCRMALGDQHGLKERCHWERKETQHETT